MDNIPDNDLVVFHTDNTVTLPTDKFFDMVRNRKLDDMAVAQMCEEMCAMLIPRLIYKIGALEVLGSVSSAADVLDYLESLIP